MPIYDVENRFSYYKSYSDNILVGPPLPTMGSSVWERGVSGSVVSGSEEYKTATLLSDYAFKKANPFFRSGEPRYLRLSSNSQTIKDSITPNIVDIYQTGSWGSGSLTKPDNTISTVAGQSLRLLFSSDRKPIFATNSPADRINNIEWEDSYPFEKKYSYVRDSVAILTPPFYTKFTEKSVGSGPGYYVIYFNETSLASSLGFTIYKTSFNILVRISQVYVDQTGSYSAGLFNNSSDPIFFIPTLSSKILANRIVFGINHRPLSVNRFVPGLQNIYEFATGSIIEGWKYGLYNGLPTNFSAVFRQNHFGQFRDMLEQRIYTQTYNNPEIGGPMDANGGIRFISGSALAGESNNYATASIYADTNMTEAYRVNPYGSGIFDRLYRASQPWHADDTRVIVRASV